MRLLSSHLQFLQLLPSLLNFVVISSFPSDLVMKLISMALLLCVAASASGSSNDCVSLQKACAAKGGAIKTVLKHILKFSEARKVAAHVIEWLKKVKD